MCSECCSLDEYKYKYVNDIFLTEVNERRFVLCRNEEQKTIRFLE
jgi:hypothetical protein